MHQLSYIFLFAIFTLWGCGESARSKQERKDSIATQDSITKVRRKKNQKSILFLGNSLTAGHGLDNPQESSFPGLLQKKIDAVNLNYRVINAGVSGATSTDGREKINWLLKQKVDVLVIELGANDGLRGISPHVIKENLQEIMDIARRRYKKIRILIAGMEAPPNMGLQYIADFRKVYQDLEEDNRGVILIPFILQGIGGKPEFNQSDGIHPTAEGHQMMANIVWKYLRKVL